MGPPDNTKLTLGVFAATGAVLVSYFLLKKLAQQPKNKKEKDQISKKTGSLIAEVSRPAYFVEDTQSQKSPGNVSREDTQSLSSPVSLGPDYPPASVDSQSSYYFVSDRGEGDKKASDRSSDESSYDVIDDEEKERIVEEVEIDERERVARGDYVKGLKDSPPAASMIVVGDLEKTDTSIYASADEMLSSPVKAGEQSTDSAADLSQEVEEEMLGDTTVLRSGEGKLVEGQEEEGVKIDVMEESTADSSFLSVGTADSQSVTDVMAGGDTDTKEVKVIPVAQAVLSPVEKGDNLSKRSAGAGEDSSGSSAAEIAEVISACSERPGHVTLDQLTSLSQVLRRSDLPSVQTLALDALTKVTAFSNNNTKLQTAGVPGAVKTLMMSTQGQGDTKVMNAACQVVTNLTLDPQNCKDLEPVLPTLVAMVTSPDIPEALLLNAIRPVINFSSDPTFHRHLTKSVQSLLDMLDKGPPSLRIQSLRILVNLSLNSDVVPNILAAKSPDCLLSLLGEPTPQDLTLRTLTLLLNLQSAVTTGGMTLTSLPVEDKADSPSTVHSALTSPQKLPSLKTKVFALTQHTDEDVKATASRLYQALSDQKEL